MPILAAPYEIFDIGDGESVDITVTRWERGDEIEMKATDGHTFRSSPLRLHLTAPLAPGKHPSHRLIQPKAKLKRAEHARRRYDNSPTTASLKTYQKKRR
jgi:hypothetical protein